MRDSEDQELLDRSDELLDDIDDVLDDVAETERDRALRRAREELEDFVQDELGRHQAYFFGLCGCS